MKIRIRNKKLVFGILAVAIAFTMVASAGLLTLYGTVETTTTVKQSLRLDGNVFSSGYDDITITNDIGDLVAGSCEWGQCHDLWLHHAANNPVSTEVSSVVSPSDGGLTTMIAAEVQGAGYDCSDYTVPSGDVTVDDFAALEDAVNNDESQTIIVADGDYTTGNVLTVTDSDTIVAESYLGAEIDTIKINSDDATIKGFKIYANAVAGEVGAIYIQHVDDITITCNEITKSSDSGANPRGIITVGAADYSNVLIENNKLYDLATGIYTNPHTGTIDIYNNYFADCTAGIGCANNANVKFNVFDWDGEALGIDDTFTTSGRNLIVQYNNFYGDASLNNYGTTGQNAPYNWWGCDGVDITAPVNAGWNTWNDGDIVELQPDETVHFIIKYCTLDNAVGDYTSTVSFLPAD